MKFKAGDRVKNVGNGKTHHGTIPNESPGTIIDYPRYSLDGTGKPMPQIKFDYGPIHSYSEAFLELLDKEETMQTLKQGDKVTYDNMPGVHYWVAPNIIERTDGDGWDRTANQSLIPGDYVPRSYGLYWDTSAGTLTKVEDSEPVETSKKTESTSTGSTNKDALLLLADIYMTNEDTNEKIIKFFKKLLEDKKKDKEEEKKQEEQKEKPDEAKDEESDPKEQPSTPEDSSQKEEEGQESSEEQEAQEQQSENKTSSEESKSSKKPAKKKSTTSKKKETVEEKAESLDAEILKMLEKAGSPGTGKGEMMEMLKELTESEDGEDAPEQKSGAGTAEVDPTAPGKPQEGKVYCGVCRKYHTRGTHD